MKFRRLARDYTYRKRYLSIYSNELQFLQRLELLAASFYKKAIQSKDLASKDRYRKRAIGLLQVYISIMKEPELPVPKPINKRRNILSFCDSDCKTFFGFNCQSDLYRLLKCLLLDKERIF